MVLSITKNSYFLAGHLQTFHNSFSHNLQKTFAKKLAIFLTKLYNSQAKFIRLLSVA